MASPPSRPGDPDYIKYSTVTGYFLQDEPGTDSNTFNYVCEGFSRVVAGILLAVMFMSELS
jgi:hypothetical protein